MHMHMQCICFEKCEFWLELVYYAGISVFGDYSEEEEGEEEEEEEEAGVREVV